MEDLISVIVPVYGVEAYLEECIESIINQKYKNLEIILIDDGSPDKCGEICDKYAAQDKRIRVIHNENHGISYSRNCGLDIAKGEYIAFCDSDDVLDPRLYEYLYGIINKCHTDISMCSFREFINGDKYEIDTDIDNAEIIEYSKKSFAENLLLDFPAPYIMVCNKLFRREIIGDTRFKLGVICEDNIFMSDLIVKGISCARSSAHLYMYRRNRNGSTMSTRNAFLLKSSMASKVYQYKVLRNSYGEEYRKRLLCKTLNRCSRHTAEVYWYMNRPESKGMRSDWCTLYDEEKSFIIGTKEKLKLGLFRYFPHLYYVIMKKKVKVV